MLLALLGFKDVKVLKVVQTDGINRVHLEQLDPDSHCPGCGDQGKIHDRPNVELADVPGFHMQTQVVWRKHVYTCLNSFCERKTFTSTDPRIASSNARVTSRAVRQMTASVADGRTAKEVADLSGPATRPLIITSTRFQGRCLTTSTESCSPLPLLVLTRCSSLERNIASTNSSALP